MSEKQSHEDLEQRIKELEMVIDDHKAVESLSGNCLPKIW
jgi:hypothetical protein